MALKRLSRNSRQNSSQNWNIWTFSSVHRSTSTLLFARRSGTEFVATGESRAQRLFHAADLKTDGKRAKRAKTDAMDRSCVTNEVKVLRS